MSIDTRDPRPSPLPSSGSPFALDSFLESLDWETLIATVPTTRSKKNRRELFGAAGKQGAVYRWGIAVATGSPCDDLVEALSRLACDARLGKKRLREMDWDEAVARWLEHIDEPEHLRVIDGTIAVLWAAAFPNLLERLSLDSSQRLLRRLLELRQAVLQRDDPTWPLHLILGGELGLTISRRLPQLDFGKRLRDVSLRAVRDWCRADFEAVSAAVTGAVDARLVLASMIRSRRLAAAEKLKRIDKAAWKATGGELATWVAAMTREGGVSAFSQADKAAVREDVAAEGLLDHAASFDRASLQPAMAAALGAVPKGGRLAWEVSLPEALHHDADAKLAVMLPDWDVRRGRTHLDYSGRETRLELFAGRVPLVSGQWEASIEVDGQTEQPSGPWEEVCEFTDDDVHYLEIEQAWSGGLVLQRQIMLLREDRCLLMADAVISSNNVAESSSSAVETSTGKAAGTDAKNMAPRSIQYTARLPLGSKLRAAAEEETREIVLEDGRKRAMVLPLAAGEWRVGPTACSLAATDDGHLAMTVRGSHRLYAPIWFDLQPRRFQRKRTWRQLTVTDQLRIVGRHEAVGYRIQFGSEQWMVYRALSSHRPHSVLGKHLLSDFFCSRFDSGDGSHEELITVDEGDSGDD